MSELGLGSAGWIAGGGSFAGTGKIVGETLAGAGGVLRVASGIGFAIWLFLEPLCVPLNSSEAEWIEAIEKKQQEELRREELRKKLLKGIVTANPNISQAELEKRVEMLLTILVDRANTIYNPYDNTITRLKVISTEGSSALDDSAEIDLQPWPGFAAIGGGGKEPDKKPDKDPKKTGAKVVASALTAAQLANMLNVSQKQDINDQVIAPFDPSHITRVTDTGTGQVVIEYKDGTRRIFDKKDVPGQVLERAPIGADGTNTEGVGNTAYTGGRTQTELDDLARDPDHNFQISKKTIAEREAALKVEAKGEVPGPITRNQTPGPGEFIDNNGGKWDVKGWYSAFKPKGYSLEAAIEKIEENLKNGINIIIDTTNMDAADINELYQEVVKRGYTDRVKWDVNPF